MLYFHNNLYIYILHFPLKSFPPDKNELLFPFLIDNYPQIVYTINKMSKDVIPMYSWKDEYSIGVPAVDTQHRRLFEIAGEMHALLNNELVTDKYDQIMEIINELSDYTVYHFKAEEQYMQSTSYRKFLSHKALHQDFLDKLSEVDPEQIDNGQNTYLRGILAFVCNWLVEHILQEDKQITAAS